MKGRAKKGEVMRRINFNAPEDLVRTLKVIAGRELTTVKAICLKLLERHIAEYERKEGKVL